MTATTPRAIQIRALTDVSRALTTAASFEAVLQLVVERAAQMFETPASVLMLTDENGHMVPRASVGPPAATMDVAPERFLGVPLVVSDQVTGLLAVALPEDAVPHAEEEEWLLSALADQAAVAIEKTRLDDRGRHRDRLIGIVSHDLRGPINTIMLGSSLLLDLEGLEPIAHKTAVRMMAAAERAERMIRDLLDYTQASVGGGIHIQRERNNLGSIVRGVIDEMAADDRTFELVERGDLTAMFDADRITQVIVNLVSNALSHRAPGTSVGIVVEGDSTSVSVAVRNIGTVIPAERMLEIFQPMQQLTPGAGRGQRSVGLGLFIVDSIVTAHAGTIAVTSTAIDGTCFRVRIPRAIPRVAETGS